MIIFFILGFLKICRLPMHFLPISFAFKIYQKLKSDDQLESQSINLFKSISNRLNKHSLQKQYITKDLEKIINVENDYVDKAIIISCFLGDIPVSYIAYFVVMLFFSLTLVVCIF